MPPSGFPLISLLTPLSKAGYVFVPGEAFRALLEAGGSLADAAAFAASWDDLALDTYMADQGRYRRRRHAVFTAGADGVRREAHQPHFQSVDYNPLNGGIERWFEPVRPAIAEGPSFQTVLSLCRAAFSALRPSVARWRVETHQFRIEARPAEPGRPTPEGLHRDGVDYVLVLLVARRNIASGTTTIRDLSRGREDRFTLTHPFDAVLLDDARVAHGVTAVEATDPAMPAHRDVLVVTFRAEA